MTRGAVSCIAWLGHLVSSENVACFIIGFVVSYGVGLLVMIATRPRTLPPATLLSDSDSRQPATEAQTDRHNPRWLQRCVRRLVSILLFDNAIKLHGKNKRTYDFEHEAKKRGLAMVACNLRSGNKSLLVWMVYPSPNPEQKYAEEKQEQISLADEIYLECDAGNQTSTTDDHKGVPPMLYLQTGKWVAHILINAKSPNEERSATADEGAAPAQAGGVTEGAVSCIDLVRRVRELGGKLHE